MKLSPDDPKLTAYVLGELDATERAKVEAAIAESPECQEAVAEIRALAGQLEEELAEELQVTGWEAPVEEVMAEKPVDNVLTVPPHRFSKVVVWGAIAACAVGVASLLLQEEPQRQVPVPLGSFAGTTDNKVLLDQAKVQQLTNLLAHPQQTTLNELAHEYFRAAGLDTSSNATSQIFFNDTVGKLLVRATLKDLQSISNALTALNMPQGTLQFPTDTVLTNAPANCSYTRMFEVDAKTFLKQVALAAGWNQLLDPNQFVQTNAIANIPANVLVADAKLLYEQRSRIAGIDTAWGIPKPGTGITGMAGTMPKPPKTLAEIQGLNKAQLAKADGFNLDVVASYIPPPSSENASSHVFGGVVQQRVVNQVRLAEQLIRDDVSGPGYIYNPEGRVVTESTTATYPQYVENMFITVAQEPLSTFSIDVDTASYANVRRFLNQGQLPPPDAVRIEEMLNYFAYRYPQPKGDVPFSVNLESASCPWNPEHRLLRIGLKGREMAQDKRPASNFVFLIDVSGSMSPRERLPLLKQSLRQLVKKMTESDRVAMVVYASSSGVVLPSTSCVNKEQILEAIDRLEAGGSTNGGEGIQRAYDLATENFIKGGVNRVILCTDGDFNVGITDRSDLIKLIETKAKSGVFLTALGVGTDNLKDATLQQLADKGNGNYHYLDSVEEGHKVLIEQMNGTLVTIAKDVKVQIEFNPAQVQAYRLIGYEKRMLQKEDFNNDAKDAGEIGAGHTVTALYEVVPAGVQLAMNVDGLKYQSVPQPVKPIVNGSKDLCTVKLRYKQPDGDTSKLIEVPFVDSGASYERASTDFRFAASVATFAEILKNSAQVKGANLDMVLELASESKGDDKEGYRAEFLNLVKKARELKR